MSQGRVGLGTQIKMGDGQSPETFNLIPEPKDISGPQISQEFVDFTHQQSSGGFRERKPTFKTSGDVTFSCNYIAGDTVQEDLIEAALANPAVPRNFQLIFPDNTTITFSAYVSVQFKNPMNGPEEIQVTLALEGAFTLA